MERLTKNINGVICYVGEHKQNDEDVPAEMTTGSVRDVLTSLFAYEEAEEKGRIAKIPPNTSDIDFMRLFELIMADAEKRVVVLPCKVGDVLFVTDEQTILPARRTVESITWWNGEISIRAINDRTGYAYLCKGEDFGKTVYLTREAAEAAMKKTT